MYRSPGFFQQGMNMYVPKMQASSELLEGQPTAFSLGSPAAVSANVIAAAIAANDVATTKETVTAYTSDAKFGRTLRLTPSGNPGNSAAIDVFGEDYLGQPMVERFTGASGATSILYGKKAFYRVLYAKIVTAASNAVTWAIGTGWRFGLPFKGDVAWAKEAGVFVQAARRGQEFYADRSAVLAATGGSKWIRAPFPGYVDTLIGTPDGGGSTTDAVITVKLATVAIVGLTVTIDTDLADGTTVTDQPTTLGYNANNRFRAGDVIEIAGAAASGALGDRVGLLLVPTQFTPFDSTDPGTPTTGDPRGTYESIQTPNGTEVIVAMNGDNSYNAAGNGGLHGIKQVIA